MDFNGKIAVVTGAASGLGAEVAKAFAEAGANVALIDVNKDGIASKAAELSGNGGIIKGYACDLPDFDAVQALGEQIKAEIGQADICATLQAPTLPPSIRKSSEQDKKGWDP
jgi:NAD(P)-dependent dehydrogenase (short-subunit alcohol dehydrogenase family)